MHHDHSLLDVISHCQSQSVSQSPSTSPQQHASTSSPNAATTSSDKRKSPDNRYYEHCTAAVDLSDALHSVYIYSDALYDARPPQPRPLYFANVFYFFITRFLDIFQPIFSKLCHMAWLKFQQNLCYRASTKVPPRTNEGAKSQILPIFGPNRYTFSAAVPQRGGNSKI